MVIFESSGSGTCDEKTRIHGEQCVRLEDDTRLPYCSWPTLGKIDRANTPRFINTTLADSISSTHVAISHDPSRFQRGDRRRQVEVARAADSNLLTYFPTGSARLPATCATPEPSLVMRTEMLQPCRTMYHDMSYMLISSTVIKFGRSWPCPMG